MRALLLGAWFVTLNLLTISAYYRANSIQQERQLHYKITTKFKSDGSNMPHLSKPKCLATPTAFHPAIFTSQDGTLVRTGAYSCNVMETGLCLVYGGRKVGIAFGSEKYLFMFELSRKSKQCLFVPAKLNFTTHFPFLSYLFFKHGPFYFVCTSTRLRLSLDRRD